MSNNKISQIKLPNNNEIYDIEGRNVQRISWSDYSNLSEEDKKSNTAYYITNIPLDEGGYKHAEGSVISIHDGKLNEPLKACTVDINPVQSGSGTPSPSNIRPISGWSGANIANISDVNAVEYFKGLTLGTYAFIEMSSLSWNKQADGIFRTSVPRTYGTGNFNLLSSRYTTYTGAHSTASNIQNLVNINGNGLYVNSGSATFFCADSAYTDKTVFKNSLQGVYLLYQLANPTTPTITPTQFNTLLTAFGLNGYMIPVSWQTEAGTIYGGELDVTSGVLTVTDGYIASYDGETLPSTWISDRDVYAAGTTPTTGAEVVYKLATPTEVSLTPTEITTLYGNNVIWADSGDMAITYTYESNNQIRMGDEIFSVGSNAQTISGHTVLTDVPADAVFTDTTYSVTPVTISTAQKGSDITVDDITAWNAGSVTTVTYNETTHSIIINNGVLPSLSYTAKNVPNITTENIQVVKDVSVVNSNITDG